MQQVELRALGDLFDQPWLATLATYRKDDTILLSPVWFEWDGEGFVVSLVDGDVKHVHIQRRSLVSLMIAEEASYPGRMLEVSGNVTVRSDEGAQDIFRIATRYLGEEVARRWIEQYPELEWVTVRLVPERSRALDHRNVPFLAEAKPRYPTTTEWTIQMTKTGSQSPSTK
jgi:hypothetical protein